MRRGPAIALATLATLATLAGLLAASTAPAPPTPPLPGAAAPVSPPAPSAPLCLPDPFAPTFPETYARARLADALGGFPQRMGLDPSGAPVAPQMGTVLNSCIVSGNLRKTSSS